MSLSTTAPSPFARRTAHTTHSLLGGLILGAGYLAPIAARLAIAVPFLRSGLTKWNGWFHVSPVVDFLFESMFRLHLFGRTYPFPMPDVLAHLDAVAEVALPILLIVGLATRFSALGLLVMTAVIQLTVPSGWANFHLPWAALALAIITLGPGPLSLDRLLASAFRKRSAPDAL
ncbi:MAG TPA: DoxX family protein [Steroidobacteraceae bacterium]|nr:DoxX family protein [Steroidobacteraceae bacterium]